VYFATVGDLALNRANPADSKQSRCRRAAPYATFDAVRFVGILMFAAGAAATGYAVQAIHRRRRPADVAFAVAAPVAAVIALVGLLLVFVPDFF
jgi:hypothetical protein